MANESEKASRNSWFFHRHFRVGILLLILVAELGFLHFITSAGWLKTVDLTYRLGIYGLLFLPLGIASLMLIRKRFRLSTMMIAMALLAIFLGFALRPVFKVRSEKRAAQLLGQSEIEFQLETHLFNVEENRFEEIYGHPSHPKWVNAVIGEKYATTPSADQILSVSIVNDQQLKTLQNIELPQLKTLHLRSQVSEAAIHEHQNTILALKPQLIYFINLEKSLLKRDLSWLNESESTTHIGLENIENSFELCTALKLPNLKHLGIGNEIDPTPVDWETFFDSPNIKNLRALHLRNPLLTDRQSHLIPNLQQVTSMFLTSSVTDFAFLSEMKNLRYVQLQCPAITDSEVRQIKLPDWITNVYLSLPNRIKAETLDICKENNPAAGISVSGIPPARYLNAKKAAKTINVSR